MPTTPLRSAALLAALAAALTIGCPATAAEWQMTSLPNGYQYRVAVSPTGQVFAFGGGSLQTSLDDGVTWSPVAPFVLHGFIHRFAFAPSGTIYVSDDALGVFRSTNGGVSWSSSLVTEGCDGLGANGEGVLFAGLTYTGNGKVHRSTDGGANWQGVPLPGATNGFATECIAFGDSGEVYAGSIDGFFRSRDLGATWDSFGSSFLGRHVRLMAVAANQDVFVETLYPTAFDGLYRSVDRGVTWQRVTGNAPYFSALIASPTGDLFGSNGATVMRSSNAGALWTSTGTGIGTFENLTSLAITPSGHLIAGGSRVWRSTAAVVGVEPPPARAGGATLAPIQPNPASGTTRLRFTLARAADVELGVFDIAGRRVASLAKGPHEAREHAVSLDASGLPAGLYACRLVAGGAVISRRMLVVH